MKLKGIVTVDFETLPIHPRPDYPPEPVGVAILFPNNEKKYFSWGHPTPNNTTKEKATKLLKDIWEVSTIVFWHAKFDLAVAEERLGIKPPPWERVHDAMFLAFLDDPRVISMGLKPTAERLLGLKPEERNKMVDWIMENWKRDPVLFEALHEFCNREYRSEEEGGSKSYRMTPGRAPAFTGFVPAKLAGPYAIGDVVRTKRIFDKLYTDVVDRRSMGEAYDRERRLIPVLMEMEKTGMRVDLDRLAKDEIKYGRCRDRLDDWVRLRLRAPELDIGSRQRLVSAMLSAGVVDEKEIGTTETGKVQSNKAAIERGVTDRTLVAALGYRSQLTTYLGHFMKPWRMVAENSNGLIYNSWASTRTYARASARGARTGRLASSPNWQNVPKRWTPHWRNKTNPDLPEKPVKGLLDLPRVRSYLLPFGKNDVLIDRDYSQQELRLLAHFEDGPLLAAYERNPWVDIHDYAQQLLHDALGVRWERKAVKNVAFGLLYGMGVGKLAESIGTDVGIAKQLKEAYLNRVATGVRLMYSDMKVRASEGRPIRTWGGREYYVEEPIIYKGRLLTFDYKMVNALIQGSAADVTKEAAIRYHEIKKPDERLHLIVHDEIAASVPKRRLPTAMNRLREAMESVGREPTKYAKSTIDVPLYSEGSYSASNWHDLTDYDKKGKLV